MGRAYLAYLDGLGISWIACGRDRVALARALEFLSSEFGVKRAAIVGGGRINKDFLEAGLIDEVSILIGPGIDGRTGQNALFDGRADDADPVPVRFKEVKTFPSGAVLLRYEVENNVRRLCGNAAFFRAAFSFLRTIAILSQTGGRT